MKKLPFNIIFFPALITAAVLHGAGDEELIEISAPVSMIEQEVKVIQIPEVKEMLSGNKKIVLCEPKSRDEIYLHGVNMGKTEVTLTSANSRSQRFTVNVYPAYYDALKTMFKNHPEVSILLQGNRVMLTGATADLQVMRKLKTALQFDNTRIVNLVTYSPEALKRIVLNFLKQNDKHGISVRIIGSEIYLSGQMYDKDQIKALIDELKSFLKEFPGINVNGSMLTVVRQKILIDVEMVSYDENIAKNLGVVLDSPINTTLTGVFSVDKSTSKSNAEISSKITSQINLLKKNDAAKKIYSTTMSTQSGETAEFQNGGTIYKGVSDLYKSSLTTIDYGYIVKAKPVILDKNTVNLEFSMQLSAPSKSGSPSISSSDIDINRYITKSKYIVRPGETILLSGFNDFSADNTKTGIPILSRIPWIGPRLFGNTSEAEKRKKILLVVTTRWEIDSSIAESMKKLDELRNRSVDVEMP